MFLGVGLAGVNALGIDGEKTKGIADAVSYIADLRQSDDLTKMPVGKRVAVIGGGMTAIDVAVQSKLLGAEEVTILYRRGQDEMGASVYEQDLATSKGVVIRHNAMPVKVKKKAGKLAAVVCEKTATDGGKLKGTGETFEIACDTLFKAIGQAYVDPAGGALKLEKNRIVVDDEKRTSLKGVWAGGDCVFGGKDLTSSMTGGGRESIHAALMGSRCVPPALAIPQKRERLPHRDYPLPPRLREATAG